MTSSRGSDRSIAYELSTCCSSLNYFSVATVTTTTKKPKTFIFTFATTTIIIVRLLQLNTLLQILSVGTPILSHTDLACNTSYHFAASRTVSPQVSPYHGPGPFAPFGSRI